MLEIEKLALHEGEMKSFIGDNVVESRKPVLQSRYVSLVDGISTLDKDIEILENDLKELK